MPKQNKEQQNEDLSRFQTKTLPFPIYTVDSNFYLEENKEIVVVAGGGGRAKTGVPNGFYIYQLFNDGTLQQLHYEDLATKIIYGISLHPTKQIIGVSVENNLSIFEFTIKDDKTKISCVFTTSTEAEDNIQKCCRFSPNGKVLATGGDEGILRIFNVNDNFKDEPIQCNLSSSINFIAFSNDSKYVAATSLSGVCGVWEVESGSVVKEIRLNPSIKSFLRGCVFSKENNQNLITCQGRARSKSTFSCWNIGDQSNTPLYSSYPSMKESHSAFNYLHSQSQSLSALVFGEGDIEYFNIKNGKFQKLGKKMNVHSFITPAISFSSTGKFLISGSVDRILAVTPVIPQSNFTILTLTFAILLLAVAYYLFIN